jgi:peptidoglycan/xylan/chitin deacetylase (PgdA/CDA1 family)
MIPHRTPFLLPLLFPSLVWRMPVSTRSTLYLTFDDGPVPGPTEFVLDVLKRHSIQSTFFCIGDNVRKHPAVFRSVLSHGHTVGNHTVNHLNGWNTSTDKYVANVLEFDQIASDGGLHQATRLFRPPYGRISRRQIARLKDYRIIMWDVLSLDYDRTISVERCLKQTIAACRPGSIVVFHDSLKAQKNMEYALPRLIDHFGGKDYDFGVIPTQS